MFAQLVRISVSTGASEQPVPKRLLDQFFMRDFTGHSEFDYTLPIADGLIEAGTLVTAADVQRLFAPWLRYRGVLPDGAALVVEVKLAGPG